MTTPAEPKAQYLFSQIGKEVPPNTAPPAPTGSRLPLPLHDIALSIIIIELIAIGS